MRTTVLVIQNVNYYHINSSASLNSAILLQPIHFLVNVIFLSLFISWKSQHNKELSCIENCNINGFEKVYNYIYLDYPSIILILGFINLLIWKLKVQKKTQSNLRQVIPAEVRGEQNYISFYCNKRQIKQLVFNKQKKA